MPWGMGTWRWALEMDCPPKGAMRYVSSHRLITGMPLLTPSHTFSHHLSASLPSHLPKHRFRNRPEPSPGAPEGRCHGCAPAGTSEFLASLPSLVESATRAHPEWQLIVLTPINQPWDFYT